MRFVQRSLWPCLVLLLTGCSLVVDFPEPRSSDGGVKDGGSGKKCDPGDSDSCPSGEHCCMVSDSREFTCLANDAQNCGGCNIRCNDPAAPRCGKDGCECEAGEGPCESGKCSTDRTKPAACVGCDVDSDCAGEPTNKVCVNNECVQCDRTDADKRAVDNGCTQANPVCNEEGRCVGCRPDSDDCPDGQTCNEGQGCFGCSPSKPLADNGCGGGMTPICKPAGNSFACVGCTSKEECMNGFCDEVSGACNNVCDPGAPPIMNGCTLANRGYCKQTPTGYECQACSPTATPPDCTGSRPLCLTDPTSQLNGTCVACITNTDCAATPASPICDLATRVCRAPVSSMDCSATPATPILEGGKCVQCATDAHCGTTPATPYCNPSTNTCVACSGLPDPIGPATACSAKSATTPICSTMAPNAGRCVQCVASADCAPVAPATITATPICSAAGTCVSCTTLATPEAGDAACMAATSRPRCITSGTPTLQGSCGACDPASGIVLPRGCAGMCTATTNGYICSGIGGPSLPDAGATRPRFGF